MTRERPKNLNLLTIRFPLPAIISILHRITGVLLFLSIPFALWCFQLSLTDTGFDALQAHLDGLVVKLIFWALLAIFAFHFVAGIRHLLSDVHIGDSLKSGRLSAKLTIVVAIILIILAGVWLW